MGVNRTLRNCLRGTVRILSSSIFLLGIVFLATVFLATPASATAVITVASPAAGSTVGSPVQVTASATSTSAINLMQVYVDGVKKYEVKAAAVNTSVSLAAGAHKLTIVADDGVITKAAVSFTVGSTTTSTTSSSTGVPSNALVANNVDDKTGWSSCDVCAGPGGAGATVAHTIDYAQVDPAMDGQSLKVSIGDGTVLRYATALWWQYVTPNEGATHFVYDLNFYLKDPGSAQALEFDVNQTRKTDSVKYIFGTECDIRGTHTWRVYDNYNKAWKSTGVACTAPTAYQWHHLVWEFARTSTGPQFVSVTLDGNKHYVNMDVQKRANSASSSLLNVAVQLDGNSVTTPYSEWVDGITLSSW